MWELGLINKQQFLLGLFFIYWYLNNTNLVWKTIVQDITLNTATTVKTKQKICFYVPTFRHIK